MGAALSEFAYIAPVETLDGYRAVVRHVARRGLTGRQVAILCLRDDLSALLKSMGGPLVILGRAEIPGLEAVVARANTEVASLEDDWQEAIRQSDFLWAILWQFQAEYVLHVRTCLSVAEHLLATMPAETVWLIAPSGWLWGSGADQFGDRNPAWYLAMHAHLREASRRYQVIGGALAGQPSFLLGLLVLRFFVNIVLLLVVSAGNWLLGFWHALVLRQHSSTAMPGGILAFFHEPFSFAPASEVLQALRQQNIAVHRVLQANLFRLRASKLMSDVPALYRNILSVLTYNRQRSFIGRIDNRVRASSWVFVYWQGMRRVTGKEYYQAVKEGIQHVGFMWRQADELPWATVGHSKNLAIYTRLVILNYLPEYIFSSLSLVSLVREHRPRLVVYPDGYSMIIRLAQRLGPRYRYVTAQVPHGYPNRTFPQHYYQADHYITPSQLSDLQLKDLGRDPKRIHWVHHEAVGASRAVEQAHAASPQPPVIGLIYSGSYAYWSFPNLYSELLTLTQQLIRDVRATLPEARIILKSHPNGTSPYFFAALANIFKPDFSSGMITHISEGWGDAKDWQQLTAAVAPIIFPSTPTIQFLTAGVPLLFIPGSSVVPLRNILYPHARNMPKYPFTMSGSAEAASFLARLVRDGAEQQRARQQALAYARVSGQPPAGVPARPLAEILAKLVKERR